MAYETLFKDLIEVNKTVSSCLKLAKKKKRMLNINVNPTRNVFYFSVKQI